MAISTNCPNCAALFHLPDELAGRRVKCQSCAHVFRLSSDEAAAASPAPETPTSETPSPAVLLPSSPVIPGLDDPEPPASPERAVLGFQAAVPPPLPAPSRKEVDDDSLPPLRRRRVDRDRPRRAPRPESRGADPWIIVGIVGGVLLFVGAGATTFVAVHSRPRPFVPFNQAPPPIILKNPNIGMAPFNPGNLPGNLPPIDNAVGVKIALTKGHYEAKHTLLNNDPIDPRRRAPGKLFLITLEAGKSYIIDQKSPQFDTHLHLESAPGQQLAEDDDGGEGLNSRIRFTPNQAGTYRVIASTHSRGLGEFVLSIRDASLPEPVPFRPLAALVLPKPETPRQKLPVADTRLTNLPTKTLRMTSADDLHFNAAGSSLWLLDTASVLRQISLPDMVEEKRLQLPQRATSLAVSQAGLLVALGPLQETWIIDPATLEVKNRLNTPGATKVLASAVSNFAYAVRQGQVFGNPFINNAGGVILLDLTKGQSVNIQNVPTQHATLTPDGRHYFAQGQGETLTRYRVDNGALVFEQSSPRIAQNGHRINVSRDNKYVCLPSGGGNFSLPGAPAKPYSTYVFAVDQLQTPVFTIPSGAYPEVVGFDPKAGSVYAQNADQALLVFDLQGNRKAGYGQRGGGLPEKVLQFAPAPEGGKLLLRYSDKLVYAELGKNGEPLAAIPERKIEVHVVKESKVVNERVTPDDPDFAGKPARELRFDLEAGVSYSFDCASAQFKPLIRLADDAGNPAGVAFGASGTATLNARPAKAGIHRLYVSALQTNGGDFTVTVTRNVVDPKPSPKSQVKKLTISPATKEIRSEDELTADGDAKRFSFLATSSTITYRIVVTAEGFTPALRLTSATGEVLQETTAKAGEKSAQLLFRPTQTGRVTLAVSANDKKGGKFIVTIQR